LARQTFSVEERTVTVEDLKTAKEAFITSTTKQILPVKQIDAIHFSQNKMAKELLQRFKNVLITG
jgi:branched-chain amino acid aminotransferase